MLAGALHTLGGLGLFLLGVLVMTAGLKGLAGDLVRRTLAGFTRSPTSGALTGALTTAVLQSSSATTVMAVGFVAAGLLTFAQALGIIFGANLGTTVTGWLVALIGFKLKIGLLALPIVLAGVLLRIFARGRLAQLGYALAGFGLVFVGIGEMQTGMEGLGPRVTPDQFPADTWTGRLQLLAIGVLITLVTQSSSAGVATALTAVHTGAINFSQAAAMVIGMDIGTTVTAALAAIGGSVETRRTGYSHVCYNLFTGLGALALLTPYTLLWQRLAPAALTQEAELLLVGFHTLFNLLGVALVLPVAPRFARLMMRLVPTRGARLSERLDPRALAHPMLALELVHATLKHCTEKLLENAEQTCDEVALDALACELQYTRDYVDRIHLEDPRKPEWQCLLASIHAIDHLSRLDRRFDAVADCVSLDTWTDIDAHYRHFRQLLVRLPVQIAAGDLQAAAQAAATLADALEHEQENIRTHIMEAVARGRIDTLEGDRRLGDARWLRRVCFHLARITHHLHTADRLLHGTHAQAPKNAPAAD